MAKIVKLKLIKIFIYLFILNIFSTSQLISEQKKCEIKYGEVIKEEGIEVNKYQVDLSSTIKSKHKLNCYKIGLEHDKNRNPLKDKPIYACCYNEII